MAKCTQLFKTISLFVSLIVVAEGRDLPQDPPSNITTLPDPHIIILGPTGVGKSSLANVLIGGSPDCENCTFEICPGTDSCTKETTYAVGNYVGNGPLFTIVDTPGFGDSDNDDNVLIDEMIQVLKEVVKTANSLVILFNGQNQRFDESVQQMLREMEALFGKEEFWRHAILGVSFWSFSENDQMARNVTGQTEEWWTADMNRQLQEKFHLDFNLSSVFIDSWAKMSFNIDDPFQQVAFERETQKLWDLTEDLDVFEFKTIEDVLNELTVCKSTLEDNITEIWRAIESHTVDIVDLSMVQGEIRDEVATMDLKFTDDISYLSAGQEQNTVDILSHQEILETHADSIEGNDAAIEAHDEAISKNTVDIVDLRIEQGEIGDEVSAMDLKFTGDIGSLSAGQERNTVDILSHQEMLESHAASIEGNAAAIEALNSEILAFLEVSFPPLGTILPWTSVPTKVTTNFVAAVPDGWQLCDGGLINRGPWRGQATPNINGNEYFLRGSSSGERVLDTEEDTFQDHVHVDNGHRHTIDPHSHAAPGAIHFGFRTLDSRDFDNSVDTDNDAIGSLMKWLNDTAEATATMQSSSSGLAGAKAEYRKGAETRPKNMRVMYIMRIGEEED